MLAWSRVTVPVAVALLAAILVPARADERAKLNACYVLVAAPAFCDCAARSTSA